MRPIITTGDILVPEGIVVEIKARKIFVKGPRGQLSKDLSHVCADMYITEEEGVRKVKVDCHMRRKKELSSLRTVLSHINNMITGVTKGFRYKMRLVYAHFPINAQAEKDGNELSIRNFLGEKRVRQIPMGEGVKVVKDLDVKDQIIIEGNSIDNVSRACALIHQSCLVKHKDIRKFLDGIYVSETGFITN